MPQPDSPRKLVSLVFPAYNEVENTAAMVDFFREVSETYPDYAFEMVVIDDGSSDGTADNLISLARPDEPIRVASLSRNFGSHAALSAGLGQARGEAAITLSADRQEPLEAVGLFLAEWADGADLVWGLRSVRVQDKAVQGIFARSFAKVYQRNSELSTYPAEGPSQLLVSRAVIDTLNAMPEHNRNLLAMAAWSGFTQRRIAYEQLPRPHGTSKWTFQRKVKLVMDSFVEFSRAPLEWIIPAGVISGALGFVLLLVGLVLAVTTPGLAASTAAVCGTVLLVGGVNLFALGLLGEYVWRAGDDARRRPLYVIARVLDASGGPAPLH